MWPSLNEVIPRCFMLSVRRRIGFEAWTFKKKPNPENEHACLLLMLWYKYTRLLNLFPFTISANCKNWDSYIYVFILYYYILLCVHCIYEQKTQIMICIYMYSCIILNTNVCLFHRFVFSFLDRKISFFFFWWTPNIEKKTLEWPNWTHTFNMETN